MLRLGLQAKLTISNPHAVRLWVLYATVLFLAALTPLVFGPDEPSPTQPSASMTMTFVVMGVGTAFNGLTNRRDPTSAFTPPLLKPLAISLVPILAVFLATELPRLQRGLVTTELTGGQWLVCIGLALLLPIVVETSKWVRRRRLQVPAAAVDVATAVAPARARAGADLLGGADR